MSAYLGGPAEAELLAVGLAALISGKTTLLISHE